MVLTDTAPTTRRLVNCYVGSVVDSFTAHGRTHLTTPYFKERAGAWGRPQDAVDYASFSGQNIVVKIVDVRTGETWFVPVPDAAD